MNNIQDSSNKIKNMYDKLSYFDQYGSQVILFIVLSLLVFLVYSYCSVMLNVQVVKDDWINQRCNPKVMPFAGFINKPPGKSIADFTQENFTFCVQNILKSISGYSLQPLTYTTNILEKIYLAFLKDIQKIREMMNNVRNSMSDVAKEIMGRILNIMIPLQQIIVGVKDVLGKIQGIITAALFTSLGSYYALKSLLGSIVEFIVIILTILVSIIVVLWILPFTWPAAAANSAIFLAVAIPLTIIVVFLTQVMGIQSSAVPQLRCFDENTMITCKSGNTARICDVEVGDTLLDGTIITAKMKVSAENLDMYSLTGIIVSGCHIVKYEDSWIPVSAHPSSEKVDKYEKPYVYCLNTSTKTIVMNDITFSDWDEIWDENLEDKKKYICEKFDLSAEDIGNQDIHKYLDAGFDEKTIIVLKNGTFKYISRINIDDVLENGEVVYGLVVINGTQLTHKITRNLGKNKSFISSTNITFSEKNLEKTASLQVDAQISHSRKIYHLLTDKGTFKVCGLIMRDYNSCIDLDH